MTLRARAGVLALILSLLAVPAIAATSGPLANRDLGVERETDAGNQIYYDWQAATGNERKLLGKIARQGRARWYGEWTGTGNQLVQILRRYIDSANGGDPSKVVTMSFFRQWPRGEGDRNAFSRNDKARYKAWYDAAARAIGDSRVAVVLEPDLPLITGRHGTKDPASRMALTRYAVAKLAALPRTQVYLDTGSADWLTINESVELLTRVGIGKARGFALGATHYDSTKSNVIYCRNLASALARRGFPGKRCVIDTADNGRPFTFNEYKRMLASGKRRNHFDNADICRSMRDRKCNTLGIPPTTRTSSKRWGLGKPARGYAAKYVDAYLWFGRPWLKMQSYPYCKLRAIQAARTTPWQRTPRIPQATAGQWAKQNRQCFEKPWSFANE